MKSLLLQAAAARSLPFVLMVFFVGRGASDLRPRLQECWGIILRHEQPDEGRLPSALLPDNLLTVLRVRTGSDVPVSRTRSRPSTVHARIAFEMKLRGGKAVASSPFLSMTSLILPCRAPRDAMPPAATQEMIIFVDPFRASGCIREFLLCRLFGSGRSSGFSDQDRFTHPED